METDTNPQPQIRQNLVFCRRGEETEGSRTLPEKPTESTNLGSRCSQRLNCKLGSLHGTNLGPLHICCNCIAWSSCGILTAGAGLSLTDCYLPLRPFPPAGLPPLTLIGEEEPNLIVTSLVDIHGKPALF